MEKREFGFWGRKVIVELLKKILKNKKKRAWMQGAGKAAYFQEGRREKPQLHSLSQPFKTAPIS